MKLQCDRLHGSSVETCLVQVVLNLVRAVDEELLLLLLLLLPVLQPGRRGAAVRAESSDDWSA